MLLEHRLKLLLYSNKNNIHFKRQIHIHVYTEIHQNTKHGGQFF